MPILKREKTYYPSVYFITGVSKTLNKPEKIYYIRYRIDGKSIEEKVGRQFQDNMTPAKANRVRTNRIDKKQPSNEKQREIEHNRIKAKNERWTVNRLWEEYKSRNPEVKSIAQDNNRYKNHIKPHFGNVEPKIIAQFHVDKLRINLLKTRQSGTVKNIFELLRRIIRFGERKQLCEGLDFSIQMPKNNNQKTEDLTPGQLKRLIEAIEQDSNLQAANIMKMALFTGMRRGEMFRLKWDDIDFQRGFIHLRDPKGGIDQKIPLNNETKVLLENHKKTNSPYVFPGRNGQQRTDIKKPLNRIKKRAGLPSDFRPLHGLRHVYASILASSGQVDLYTLQKLLTHKSPLMTQRYAHLRDEALKKASNLAGELINQSIADNQNMKIVD